MSQNNDDFTRDLNDRIKELEDMTRELENMDARAEDMTTEIDDEATKAEDEGQNTASLARQEGDSLFFTAAVAADQPLTLRVTNTNGDIHLTGADIDQVEIRAERTHGDEADHTHWFFQQVENDITLRPNWQISSHMGGLANKLRQQMKEGFKSSDWSSKDFKLGLDVSYDLTVCIPNKLAGDSQVWVKTANGDGVLEHVDAIVDIKTANGDLRAENIGGHLTLHSANGDLIASGVSGDVSAATANGDVSVTGVSGSVEATTSNGNIELDGGTGWVTMRTANGDAEVRNTTMTGGRFVTVSGDIKIDASFTGTGQYTFETVSGEVEVYARVPATGAHLSMKSVTGKMRAQGDWTSVGKNEWKLGEGTGPQLSTKSVSGEMTVNATIDDGLQVTHQPKPESADRKENATAGHKAEGEVNFNLDLEVERAKSWVKDLAKRFSVIIEGEPTNRVASDDTVEMPEPPAAPAAPEKPAAPETPHMPEPPHAPAAPAAQAEDDARSATAARRAHLLEAVKNGEMTVDEALAALEQDA